MERKEAQNIERLDNAFSILGLLSEERIRIEGPDDSGRYRLQGPEEAEAVLDALEGMESLRVPSERLGKDLRRFLKERDLTGGGLLLLAGLRLFFIRQEGPDTYGILMDRRFQETVPLPEVRLEHLIAALRKLDGQKGLFQAPVRRIYRAVEIPGILLEGARPRPLTPEEARERPVEGKVFVLAGGLSREDRNRAKELIAARGGRCAGSLSGRTDYLAAGTAEKLRENTLMQFQALRARGREVSLLDKESLFSLLGEAPREDAVSPIPEKNAAEALPDSGKTSIRQGEDALPIPGNSTALPMTESVPAEQAKSVHPAEETGTEPEAVPAEPVPLLTESSTESPEAAIAPERPNKARQSAAEGIEAALEQSWNDAWESRQEQEAQAIAEAAAEVKRLQEARAAGERRLQGLGILKFGERAAVRQELQRLNQSLRAAEAELSRLKRSAT